MRSFLLVDGAYGNDARPAAVLPVASGWPTSRPESLVRHFYVEAVAPQSVAPVLKFRIRVIQALPQSVVNHIFRAPTFRKLATNPRPLLVAAHVLTNAKRPARLRRRFDLGRPEGKEWEPESEDAGSQDGHGISAPEAGPDAL